MNNYIQKLLSFFYVYADELLEKQVISEINKKQISIDYLSNNKKGDIASNFFLIIKKKIIDKSYNFENELKNKVLKISFINNLEISNNGFINFFLKSDFIFNTLNSIINKKIYDEIQFGTNKKVNIEYVSANPTGPIHVAHIRGAIFGDILSNLYEKVGFIVSREYYVNDAGSQIDKLSNSLHKRYLKFLGNEIKLASDEYPGEYLIDIAKNIYLKDGDKWLINNDKTQNYFKKIAIESILSNIKLDLKLLNVNFDIFTHESEIVNSKIIDQLFKILQKKDLIYEGVLPKPMGDDVDWEPRKQMLFRSSKIEDDQDRALKKPNGEWTYFANDAAYHYNKFNRKYDKLINIWGSDHIGYIPRMNSLIKAIKNDDDNYFKVLTCQIVSLIQNSKKIKMSKRDGNFVTLANVFNKVGKDPIRYYMISTKNETAIDFDLDIVIKKNKDNNVFYCQYAYARATSVINKAKELNIYNSKIINLNDFIKNITEDELIIIKLIISYPYLIYQSAYYNEPHRIINYLELLCSIFHSIWNKGKDNESLRFIDENNISRTKVKLFWIKSFRIILKNIFSIIDIDAPKKM
ncbi:MAG: arginine--tRNA ligase [Pelagibacteraceae bacterium TMED237]|nr:MAG: arginine--tRNA ligase [Pelagibacteraceae bacterium TMED237]|tara:strand:- start:2145 stop:3878 length:1734 start_codon:yes stop_codon:yes gene_type:complete